MWLKLNCDGVAKGNPGVAEVAGVDNTFRRKFAARTRAEKKRRRRLGENHKIKMQDTRSRRSPVQRKPLKHRDYEVDLKSRVGKTQVVTSIAPLSQKAGYYCSVCECVVREYANYLDHINGKNYKRALGIQENFYKKRKGSSKTNLS
ncbi:hypothetical protein Pfo_002072 [Paulownia fortunei]|nr:hypothetical protein Pfo_002072 [Paulownia fortunei]